MEVQCVLERSLLEHISSYHWGGHNFAVERILSFYYAYYTTHKKYTHMHMYAFFLVILHAIHSIKPP